MAGGHARVADFGIAKAVTEAGGEKLTGTGVSIGTPAYMSPEQALGHCQVDARSDEYALGCVLYEMLAGEPPYTGPTAQAIIAKRLTQPVPRVSVLRETVPLAVETALTTALARSPADRFPTVGTFAAALAAPVPPVAGTRRRLRLRRPLPLALAAVVLLGAAGLWWRSRHATAGPTGPDARHIAVRYFDDMSEGGKLRFLADGFTEALIHELAAVPTLQAISRNGVAPYRGAHVSTDSIARALGVGTIVEGSVAEAGDRLRVTVAFVDAGRGTEITSTRLERPRHDVFALQDTLAQEVAAFLRRRLGQVVRIQTGRAGTRSTAAWELVQQARQLADGLAPFTSSGDVDGALRQLARADTLLARAEADDAQWAVPVTQRGWLAYQRSRPPLTGDRSTVDRITREALAHAERALRIAPRDADALELRGTLRYWRWLNNLAAGQLEASALLDGAEADLRGAVAASPTQAQAWSTLSHLLANKSNAEAKLAALRAYESDPYLTNADVIVWRLFTSSYDLEDQVEATHWCEEGRRRFPADPRFAQCQLYLLTFANQRPPPDPRRAWSLLEAFVAKSPPEQRVFRRLDGQLVVAAVLVRAGLPDSARAVALRSRGDAAVDPSGDLLFGEVFVRALLDDRDEALRLLAKYLAINPQRRGESGGWWFRSLQQDPRYHALMGTAP